MWRGPGGGAEGRGARGGGRGVGRKRNGTEHGASRGQGAAGPAERSARPSAARRPLLGAGSSAAGSGRPRAQLQAGSAASCKHHRAGQVCFFLPFSLNPELSEAHLGGALPGFGLVSSRYYCHKRRSPSEDEFVGCGDRYPKVFMCSLRKPRRGDCKAKKGYRGASAKERFWRLNKALSLNVCEILHEEVMLSGLLKAGVVQEKSTELMALRVNGWREGRCWINSNKLRSAMLWYTSCCMRRGTKEREVLQCLKLTAPFPAVKAEGRCVQCVGLHECGDGHRAGLCAACPAQLRIAITPTRAEPIELTFVVFVAVMSQLWCDVWLCTDVLCRQLLTTTSHDPRVFICLCFLRFNTDSLLAGVLRQR